eukprot:m.473554 g.473554  ORF g.473554 m.473554 type:complete len:116 (-) comp34522_c0_seq1:122-469(-)
MEPSVCGSAPHGTLCTGAISSLALDSLDQLNCGTYYGGIQVWSATDYTLLRSLEGHSDAVRVLSSNKVDTLFSGSHDGTIRMWSETDGSLLRTLKGHPGRVTALVFAPNGTLFSA